MMQFPAHKCGLYLTHNEHKDYYQTAKEYIDDLYSRGNEPDFVSDDEKQKCIETDEIWNLHWYPDTPVGFYSIYGSTLESVLLAGQEHDKEEI